MKIFQNMERGMTHMTKDRGNLERIAEIYLKIPPIGQVIAICVLALQKFRNKSKIARNDIYGRCM